MEVISSSKNEKIKNIAALLKSKKARDEQGCFVIEGTRLFKDTLKTASEFIESIYVSEGFQDKSDISLPDTVTTYSVKDSVFEAISGTVTSQGIMAVVRKPEYKLNDILLGQTKHISPKLNTRLLVLENIQDPGNLGTMLRTAEAAGMTGIILSGDCADIYSPKVVRSSMGSIFRMPFVYCENFIESLNEIKKKGVTIYAAYLHGGASYKDIVFDPNYAILIGNEGNGLTDAAVNSADKRVFIPMAGEIESLNAAVAAAILMYK